MNPIGIKSTQLDLNWLCVPSKYTAVYMYKCGYYYYYTHHSQLVSVVYISRFYSCRYMNGCIFTMATVFIQFKSGLLGQKLLLFILEILEHIFTHGKPYKLISGRDRLQTHHISGMIIKPRKIQFERDITAIWYIIPATPSLVGGVRCSG